MELFLPAMEEHPWSCFCRLWRSIRRAVSAGYGGASLELFLPAMKEHP